MHSTLAIDDRRLGSDEVSALSRLAA